MSLSGMLTTAPSLHHACKAGINMTSFLLRVVLLYIKLANWCANLLLLQASVPIAANPRKQEEKATLM